MFSLHQQAQALCAISLLNLHSYVLSAESIKLASSKIASFAQLLNYQRTKLKLKEFDNTHVEALKDLFNTVDKACLDVIDLDQSNADILFNSIDTVEKLTDDVTTSLKQMPELYGSLMVYRQKTTSLKTRVRNVFKKKGSETSTTSTEDKQQIKKELMESKKQLTALVDKCIAVKKNLKNTKTSNDITNYALQLLTSFVEEALIPTVEYCISDITV